MLTLPILVNKKNKVTIGLLFALAFYLAYSIPNQRHLFEPKFLPLTSWDLAIPFNAWSIVIYMSEYLLFVMAYLMFKSDSNRNKYLFAYLWTLFAGGFFFIFFPTTYPRLDYPIPTNTPLVISELFQFLRRVDDPSNCFPSMHVACCFLTTYAFLDKTETKPRFWAFLVWSVMISLSTLPTKQHYIADIVAGFVLATVAYWIFYHRTEYVAWADYIRIKKKTFITADYTSPDAQTAKSALDSSDN